MPRLRLPLAAAALALPAAARPEAAGTYAHFCRIHLFMRGALPVASS